MKPDEFNAYCKLIIGVDGDYWNDLNIMAEVVEKLIKIERNKKHAPLLDRALDIFMRGDEIQICFRGFIISTMKTDGDYDAQKSRTKF